MKRRAILKNTGKSTWFLLGWWGGAVAQRVSAGMAPPDTDALKWTVIVGASVSVVWVLAWFWKYGRGHEA